VKKIIVSIDGPAVVGKGTASRLLARRLGFLYIDSGAIYRALSWRLLVSQSGRSGGQKDLAPLLVEKVLGEVSDRTRFRITNDLEGRMKLYFDQEDLTSTIRSREVETVVPHVARLPKIREWVTEYLRELAEKNDLVVEGRDIGTVVFPSAQVKFFLRATTKARAQRRYLDLSAQNISTTVKQCERDIEERDKLDMSREVAPLREADDAIPLETTGMSVHQVVTSMEQHVHAKLPFLASSPSPSLDMARPPILIAVAGPIGVGKTSLCHWLSRELGIPVFAENPDDNPFIQDYYSDPQRWAFQSQMWFLFRKYELLTSVKEQRSPAIIDRTLHEDYIFAKVLLDKSKSELELFERWYSSIFRSVPEPDLIISLEASVDSLVSRIAKRNRPYEQGISRELLESLDIEYQRWISGYGDPVLRINTDQEDVHSAVCRSKVLLYVNELLGSLQK